MRIENATEADAAALAEIHARSATTAYAGIFPETSAPPTGADLLPLWFAVITDPACTVLAIHHEEAVIGGVALQPEPAVPSGNLLTKLYVHPTWWGSGAGSALHDRAVSIAAETSTALNLWVLEDNTRARHMYERRGWTLVRGRYLANDPPEVRDVLYQLDIE